MAKKTTTKALTPVLDRVLAAGGTANIGDVELVAALFDIPYAQAREVIDFGLQQAAKTSPAALVSLFGNKISPAIRFALAADLCGRIEASGTTPKTQISNPRDVVRIAMSASLSPTEAMYLITLNNRNKIIRHIRIAQGIKDACLVKASSVMALVLMDDASGFIVYHNHPSGEASFSEEDKALYRRLNEAARIMGVQMVDGMTVAGGDFASMRETGGF